MIRTLPTVILIFAALLQSAAADEPVSFSRDVLPILSDRCFHCHGPDKAQREADLRLDQESSATEDRGDYRVVFPGSSQKSELVQRIISDDSDTLMPPPDSGRKRLTKSEVKILQQWIDQGAKWGRHWSFEKPVRPELPIQGLKPIDAFVVHRLEQLGFKQRGLKLSPRASKRVLIRRVTLDLIGISPSPEEVNDFLNDTSPDAYEKVVDRLLRSPMYGERMAWPWLDAARYADSSGYQGDPERTMWPWRDWAINALNRNMPFDQFTIEQLAGDLLPNATPEQRLATAFNRNHMHNSEGGRIAEETRIENVFDRTETTGTVWLGLTLQCARCHDHKFDPTSNQDYFAFFDFFNQTSENGRTDRSVAVPPAMDYVHSESRKRKQEVEQEISRLTQKLAAPSKELDAAQAVWEKNWLEQNRNQWSLLETVSAKSANGATISIRPDRSLHVTGKRPEKDTYEILLRTPLQQLTGIRLDALVDPDSIAKGTGRDEKGNFVLSEIELFAKPAADKTAQFQRLKFSGAEADLAQGSYVIEKAIDGKIDNEGWAVNGHTRKEPRWANLKIENPPASKAGFELKVRLRFESQHTHHTLALFQLSATAAKTLAKNQSELNSIMQIPVAQRTPEQSQRLRLHYRTQHEPTLKSLASDLARARQELSRIEKASRPVKVMIMDALPKPRDTFVLVKGLYNNVTDQKVRADVPGMLPPLAKPETGSSQGRFNRLDLARWIVSRDNPLTARVTVNRFWQTFFGRGLVATPNDFGLQGQHPSHPALLDWLAVELMESGWNVKRLHKLIVMSDTYQQAARVTQLHLEADPENIYLARSPRYRLPSWMIRDQALAASGLLDRKLGGPPVKPYQPAGIWSEATFGKKRYAIDPVENLHRRSIYTFWRRIIGPTMFFDSAKRQTCEVKPNRTNTPLHALTTLNDTTFVEAARFLAQSAQRKFKNPADQLQHVFLALTSREPTESERKVLLRSYEKAIQNFQSNPDQATQLLSVGKKTGDRSLDPTRHAALTVVVNLLLNLDEVLVRP